jgi:hypothetical protein
LPLPNASREQAEAALLAALKNNSPAKAASLVAKKYGVPRKELYALALKWKQQSEPDDGDE